MKYRLSRQASRDIDSICNRITQFSRPAGTSLERQFRNAMRFLARFPGVGHRRADVRDEHTLFWSVGNYVVAYRVAGKEIVVVRVLHGARDFRKLFKRDN
jgi:plasmid stabilization system protein ParE